MPSLITLFLLALTKPALAHAGPAHAIHWWDIIPFLVLVPLAITILWVRAGK